MSWRPHSLTSPSAFAMRVVVAPLMEAAASHTSVENCRHSPVTPTATVALSRLPADRASNSRRR